VLVRGLNALRKTADDRKAERRAEQWGEFMGGMDDADLAQLHPYVQWNPDESRYEVNVLEVANGEGKIWERYTYVEEMSAAESRKLASQEEANKGAVDAVSDTLKLKEYLRGRK